MENSKLAVNPTIVVAGRLVNDPNTTEAHRRLLSEYLANVAFHMDLSETPGLPEKTRQMNLARVESELTGLAQAVQAAID